MRIDSQKTNIKSKKPKKINKTTTPKKMKISDTAGLERDT
jgi:hypothetical protein